jgi:hypothetical protein
MRTTIDIPDALFRRAKATAAMEGKSLRQIVVAALESQLRSPPPAVPAWKALAGGLRDLRRETRRVERRIALAFEHLDEEES